MILHEFASLVPDKPSLLLLMWTGNLPEPGSPVLRDRHTVEHAITLEKQGLRNNFPPPCQVRRDVGSATSDAYDLYHSVVMGEN